MLLEDQANKIPESRAIWINSFYVSVQGINHHQPRGNFRCRKLASAPQLLDERAWYFSLQSWLNDDQTARRETSKNALPPSFWPLLFLERQKTAVQQWLSLVIAPFKGQLLLLSLCFKCWGDLHFLRMRNVIAASCCQQESLLLCNSLCWYQPGRPQAQTSLFKQPKCFMVLPWKCASHPRAETFLSRPQPNQNQKLSVWKPCLEYLHLNVQEVLSHLM